MNHKDLWSERRHPNGEFKLWMHTWTMKSVTVEIDGITQNNLILGDYWSPLPWLWDENPDGEFLIAAMHVGALKNLPAGWHTFKPPADGPEPYPRVYAHLFNGPGKHLLDNFLRNARSKHAALDNLEFVRLFERYLLFDKPRR